MMDKKCVVCKSLMIIFFKKNNYIILRCSGCGLGLTSFLKEQKGAYHRDETYLQEEKLFRNIFAKRVDILMKLVNPKSVLEVGCSTGLMLQLFKEKECYAYGVEISKKSADKSKDRGIDLYIGDFLNFKTQQKFDLIVFNHTLEHISDPNKFISKAKSFLKEGGFIYIDLPNFGSLSSVFFKNNWQLLLPAEHIWHFTENSLVLLLQKHGFKMSFIEKASGIWDYKNPFLGLWISLTSFKKRFFTEVITALPSWVITKFQLGSDLMVIAKKT